MPVWVFESPVKNVVGGFHVSGYFYVVAGFSAVCGFHKFVVAFRAFAVVLQDNLVDEHFACHAEVTDYAVYFVDEDVAASAALNGYGHT